MLPQLLKLGVAGGALVVVYLVVQLVISQIGARIDKLNDAVDLLSNAVYSSCDVKRSAKPPGQ